MTQSRLKQHCPLLTAKSFSPCRSHGSMARASQDQSLRFFRPQLALVTDRRWTLPSSSAQRERRLTPTFKTCKAAANLQHETVARPGSRFCLRRGCRREAGRDTGSKAARARPCVLARGLAVVSAERRSAPAADFNDKHQSASAVGPARSAERRRARGEFS
ncbi:hypothetical protein AOLI_G00330170 [Acnodon oligacanthus]